MSTSVSNPTMLTARKRVFDFDSFEKVTKEVQYVAPEPLTDPSQLRHIDSKELLELVNIGRKRKALADAKATIEGGSAAVLSKFLASYKFLPKFAAEKFSSRKEQDAAILASIRANPALFAMLKEQLTLVSTEDEDDSEGEE